MTDAFGLAWRYPDEHQDALVAELAKLHGVGANQILLGDGSGEILKLGASAFTGPGRGLVVADPTFEAVAHHARTGHAEVTAVRLTPDYRHDLSKMLGAAGSAGLVYVCNPNNPTASLTPKGEVRAFLSKELIPEIDRTYRTQPFRVLSGHSAGGQFALYCLTSDPTLFQAYFALSPSLDWDDELPLRSLESYFTSTQTMKTFVYIGRGDDYAGGKPLADFNKLVEILGKAPQGVRSQIRSFPDETHTTLPLLGQIDALRSLYSGWRLPDAILDKGLAAVQVHYDDLSKMLGRQVTIPANIISDLGYTALERGKIKEAIALFESNVEVNPNSADAYDSLADAYLKDRQLLAAKSAEDHSVQLARQWANPNLIRFEQKAKKLEQQFQEQEMEKKKSGKNP